MRRTAIFLASLGTLTLTLAACARVAARAPDTGAPATDSMSPVSSGAGSATQPTASPRLTKIAPDTVHIGKGESPQVTLSGSGFVPGAVGTAGVNIVLVGPAKYELVVANATGSTISVPIVLTFSDGSGAVPRSFTPGTYAVRVQTPRGTSNALSLTMIP